MLPRGRLTSEEALSKSFDSGGRIVGRAGVFGQEIWRRVQLKMAGTHERRFFFISLRLHAEEAVGKRSSSAFGFRPLIFPHGAVYRRGRLEPVHAAVRSHRQLRFPGQSRAQCTKSTIRKLIIRVHLETMDRARERLTAVPDAMRQRAALVEHPFGTLKDRHGYGGLLCRGLSLAGAEMGLSAWAYNFTRVINLVGTQGLLGAIRVHRMAARSRADRSFGVDPRKIIQKSPSNRRKENSSFDEFRFATASGACFPRPPQCRSVTSGWDRAEWRGGECA